MTSKSGASLAKDVSIARIWRHRISQRYPINKKNIKALHFTLTCFTFNEISWSMSLVSSRLLHTSSRAQGTTTLRSVPCYDLPTPTFPS
eukprot:764876-Hanusia_phi.AAC.2